MVGVYQACLDCQLDGAFGYSPAIYLQKVADDEPQYRRINSCFLDNIGPIDKFGGEYDKIYIRQQDLSLHHQSRKLSGLSLFVIDSRQFTCTIHVFPREQWDPQTGIFQTSTTVGQVGAISFSEGLHDGSSVWRRLGSFTALFGLSPGGKTWCRILDADSRKVHEIHEFYTHDGWEMSQTKRRRSIQGLSHDISMGYQCSVSLCVSINAFPIDV